MVTRDISEVSDGPLKRLVDSNFIQYASYVIRDRAIPNVDDGLKPVQRRILHSLHENDDGKLIKVANIAGYCMQFHPHGNVSIEDALVTLVNKRYLIEGQGNFGNVLTGDPAAAARYIECRLTPLARDEIFNDDLTDFVPTYDGRKNEPVVLPARIPLLLMLGAEGIAVGIATRILPHNFSELLDAQVAILQKKGFEALPDFPQGGLMDA
jgi:topoisomerase-4 subunit A